ncbi:TPA: hypothetical protein ACQ431_002942 [Citrobacter murliniae]
MKNIIGRFIPVGEPDYRKPFNAVTMEKSDFLAPSWKGLKEDGSEYHVTEKAWRFESSWNGEGLPPVGCECEWLHSLTKGLWTKVKIMYLSEWVIVMRSIEQNAGNGVDISRDLIMDNMPQFRPIRSEADKKRDECIVKLTDAICGEIPDTGMATAAMFATRVYDAISAGKIPHIRIE